MSDIRARATDHGTVMLAITDGDGRRAHVAENLKAQMEVALVTARAHFRAEPPSQVSHTWMEADQLPGDERG
jgi:hypothetical protein